MDLPPLRIAQRRNALEQHPQRRHRTERTDQAHHRTEHAGIGASIAIFRIERIADKAAIAGMARAVPGKVRDLPLKPPQRGAGERNPRRHAGIRNRAPLAKSRFCGSRSANPSGTFED